MARHRGKEIVDTESNLIRYVFAAQQYVTDDIHGYALPEIFRRLTPNDFSDKTNNAIFSAMRKLFQGKKEINLAAVAYTAGRAGKITQSEADVALNAILANHPLTIQGIEQAIAAVKRNSLENQSLWAMDKVANQLMEGTAEPHTIPALIDDLNDILNKSNALNWERLSCQNQVDAVLKELDRERKMTAEEVRAAKFLFPFENLNEYTGGMSRGELWTIAGESGIGKTTFAIQAAIHLASEKSKKKVLYITSEVRTEDMYRKIFSNLSQISYMHIKKYLGEQKFTDGEFESISDKGKEFGQENRLMILQTNKMDDIEGIVRTAIARKELDVLIVDHIQLMRPKTEGRNLLKSKFDGYADIIRDLKEWAQKNNIVVIALSQVNRTKEYRSNDNELTMDSVYGSSEIAMFSDGIIGLNADDKSRGTIKASVIKCRNGICGSTTLKFDGDHQIFLGKAKKHTKPFDSEAVSRQQEKVINDILAGF